MGHNNRLKRIRPDGQDPRYLHYDAGGIRDKRTLSGQKETFHTLSGVALADVRPTGPVAFVQGHQLLGLVKDGDLYHFISDGLGTVRWVTDDAVNPVASFTCDPFGNPDPGGTSGNPDFLQHTYTGSLGVRNDGAALGLYYAQQRYYDADLGRWLTPDPIGFSGGLNLYAYVGGNPTNLVDPSGLYVDATFEVSTGTLTVNDYARVGTGPWSLKSTSVFKGITSGDLGFENDCSREGVPFKGAIPRGKYVISPVIDTRPLNNLTGDTEWFLLLNPKTLKSYVDVVNPENGQRLTRDSFYIHPGRHSAGCLTFPSDVKDKKSAEGYPRSREFSRLKDILMNTQPLGTGEPYPAVSRNPLPPLKGGNFPGWLTVK